MGEKKITQEQMKIRNKLVSINLKRVVLSSAILLILYPLLLVYINIFSSSTYQISTTTPVIITFELVTLSFLLISYLTLKVKEQRISNLITKSFWMFFLLFSMYLIYIDRINNVGFTYYAIALGVLSVVPLFNMTERMYYTVIQAVFVLFIGVKFGIASKEVLDIIVLNLFFTVLSRLLYVEQVSRLQVNEKLKSLKSGNDRDPLTNFYNRKGLESIVESRWKDCVSRRKRVSLLIIDIDNFKKYNNEYGYEKGDACIATIAENIERIVLRDTDAISRLSGGRFVVFLSGTDEKEPVLLAEKVRNSVERMRISIGENTLNGLFITVSIGISSMEPGNITTFSELYDEADTALYSAKEYGRNLIVYDEQIYGRKKIRKAT